MSTIQSYEGIAPSGLTATMCRVIADSPTVLRLSDCVPNAGVFTLQLWVKASSSVTIPISTNDAELELTATTEWSRYTQTFTINDYTDNAINLMLPVGTYYIYHARMESGNSVLDRSGDSVLIEPIIFGTVNDSYEVLVNNISDDDIGFIYEIHCQGELTNPAIYHSELNEHIKINGRFKLDDIITIDTRRGKKSITKTYRGISTNIINNLDNTSKWLHLKSGFNHIIQTADTGADNMVGHIYYTNEYEGV